MSHHPTHTAKRGSSIVTNHTTGAVDTVPNHFRLFNDIEVILSTPEERIEDADASGTILHRYNSVNLPGQVQLNTNFQFTHHLGDLDDQSTAILIELIRSNVQTYASMCWMAGSQIDDVILTNRDVTNHRRVIAEKRALLNKLDERLGGTSKNYVLGLLGSMVNGAQLIHSVINMPPGAASPPVVMDPFKMLAATTHMLGDAVNIDTLKAAVDVLTLLVDQSYHDADQHARIANELDSFELQYHAELVETVDGRERVLIMADEDKTVNNLTFAKGVPLRSIDPTKMITDSKDWNPFYEAPAVVPADEVLTAIQLGDVVEAEAAAPIELSHVEEATEHHHHNVKHSHEHGLAEGHHHTES